MKWVRATFCHGSGAQDWPVGGAVYPLCRLWKDNIWVKSQDKTDETSLTNTGEWRDHKYLPRQEQRGSLQQRRGGKSSVLKVIHQLHQLSIRSFKWLLYLLPLTFFSSCAVNTRLSQHGHHAVGFHLQIFHQLQRSKAQIFLRLNLCILFAFVFKNVGNNLLL